MKPESILNREKGCTIPDPAAVEEHGRTWQNYSQDKYYLPNDAAEQDRFDLAHRDVVKKSFDNLQPGGWIEYQDASFDLDSDDNSHRGTALQRWTYFAKAAAGARGKNFESSRKYKGYLAQTGFVDIHEQKLGAWLNDSQEDPDDKMRGANGRIQIHEVIEVMSFRLLHTVLGLPEKEVNQLKTDAQRDLANPNMHGYSTYYVVYGRKPLNANDTGLEVV
ncbi:hypothetical protein BX600DRAFT_475433 [Xylariales sp. PMI_506]|nr:hypothetical protein BX600DRAFT_475433 [Xylariales sp. PMI_506]